MRFSWHLEILGVDIFPGQWGAACRMPFVVMQIGPLPVTRPQKLVRSRLYWEKLQARGQLAGRSLGFLTVPWEGLLEQDSGAPVGPLFPRLPRLREGRLPRPGGCVGACPRSAPVQWEALGKGSL